MNVGGITNTDKVRNLNVLFQQKGPLLFFFYYIRKRTTSQRKQMIAYL